MSLDEILQLIRDELGAINEKLEGIESSQRDMRIVLANWDSDLKARDDQRQQETQRLRERIVALEASR